jgi:outer membrane protein assembly factor BamA
MRPHRLISVAASTVIGLIVQFSAPKDIEAQRHEQLVEAVEFFGNRRLSDAQILKYIRTRAGQVFSVKQVQLDLEEIIALGVFNKIQTRVSTEAGAHGGIVVIFFVVELPLITELKFEGLESIEEIEIIRLLRHNRINIGKDAVFDPVRVQKAMRIIRDFLTTHYWSNVTVTTRTEQRGNSLEVSLTLVIEGNRHSFIEVADVKAVIGEKRKQKLFPITHRLSLITEVSDANAGKHCSGLDGKRD